MAYQVINGTDLFVFNGSVPFAHAMNHTLNVKMAVRNTSSKDTGLWETNAPGRFTATASCDGLCAYGSFETILTSTIAQTPLSLYFGRKVAGTDTFASSGTYASGVFYVTSWDQSAPQEGNTTYSVDFELCSGFAFVSGTPI